MDKLYVKNAAVVQAELPNELMDNHDAQCPLVPLLRTIPHYHCTFAAMSSLICNSQYAQPVANVMFKDTFFELVIDNECLVFHVSCFTVDQCMLFRPALEFITSKWSDIIATLRDNSYATIAKNPAWKVLMCKARLQSYDYDWKIVQQQVLVNG